MCVCVVVELSCVCVCVKTVVCVCVCDVCVCVCGGGWFAMSIHCSSVSATVSDNFCREESLWESGHWLEKMESRSLERNLREVPRSCHLPERSVTAEITS